MTIFSSINPDATVFNCLPGYQVKDNSQPVKPYYPDLIEVIPCYKLRQETDKS